MNPKIKAILAKLLTIAVSLPAQIAVIVPLLHLSAATASEVAGIASAIAAVASAVQTYLGPVLANTVRRLFYVTPPVPSTRLVETVVHAVEGGVLSCNEARALLSYKAWNTPESKAGK